MVLHGEHQQAIHGVNTTSDTKSFDLPFSALLGPLEIAEVYHSNHDVGTPFGISTLTWSQPFRRSSCRRRLIALPSSLWRRCISVPRALSRDFPPKRISRERASRCLRMLVFVNVITRTVNCVKCARCWALAWFHLDDANTLFRCHPLFYRLNIRDLMIWCAICLEVVGCYEDRVVTNPTLPMFK